MSRRIPAAVILTSTLLAFGLRVLPPYRAVFTTQGVNFEEGDAWFHVRSIHNLLAHFPKWSTYDPFGLYPGGENLVTRPFWDYFVAAIARIAGAGSPSGNLIDEIAAWLPAVLGALLPVPVFFLARRLFGMGAALASAVWVAIIPGRFFWVGHLGMADHHAIEVFLALVSLTLLCIATEVKGPRCWIAALTAGVALAAFFETQIAGIYIPIILAVAAVICPALASVSAVALGTCCLLLIPADGVSPWREYRWLSLITALAITLAVTIVYAIAQRRKWPRLKFFGMVSGVMLIVAGCIAAAQFRRILSLVHLVGSYSAGPLAEEVGELQPLWIGGAGGFVNLFGQFGIAWLFAIPGIAAVTRMLRRKASPALVLFSVWSAVMIYGAFLHVRMAAYAGLSCAILAGIPTAWIVKRVPAQILWLRGVAAALIFSAALAVSVPLIYLQTHDGHGPDRDWWSALTWMRWNTPEPMGDATAWYRWWPKREPGTGSVYPKSAYGILAIWDKGWWIDGIAHRIPSANGGEDGAVETSRFLSETKPENALQEMRGIGARYAIVTPAEVRFEARGLAEAAGRAADDYLRFVSFPSERGKPVHGILYRPAFYRSMAARLDLFDGRAVDTRAYGVDVYVTAPQRGDGSMFDESVVVVHHFASEKEAEDWLVGHPNESATIASTHIDQSCADLEEIPWIRLAFVSEGSGPFSLRHPGAVKIFERTQ